MKKLVIFGSGDIAQIAKYYFDIDSDYETVAFTLDNDFIHQSVFEGLPVVSFENIEAEFPPNEFDMFIALSYTEMNALRERKYKEAKLKGYKLVSYVSSKCTYLTPYGCGDNCFIFEDNTIQPYVKIGNNVTIWSGNHIGHHSEIKDHNFISSHVVISGHCVVMNNCFVGVNATIGHKVKIGKFNLIGAGSVITRDTDVGAVYVPAKSVKLDKPSSAFTL